MLKNKLCSLKSCNALIVLYLVSGILDCTEGITTTHYDKPPLQQSLPTIEKVPTGFPNLTVAERQKRLLPYINFYVSQNLHQAFNDDYQSTDDQIIGTEEMNRQPLVETKFRETYEPNKIFQVSVTPYQHKTKYTPFLDTNALPGPFVPMRRPQLQKIRVGYTPINQREKIPNYSAIYEKLSQMKLQHNLIKSPTPYQTPKNALRYFHRNPQVNYIALQPLRETPTLPKTYIHTYTPTSIDIPIPTNTYQAQEIDHNNHVGQQNENKYVNGQVTPQPIRLTQLNNPKHHLINHNFIQINAKPTYVPLFTINPQNHYIVQEHKQYHNQNHKQYLQEVIPNSKPLLVVQPKETKPIILLQPNHPLTTAEIPINYHRPSQNINNPTIDIPLNSHESSNSLSQILKRLQDSNTLPQTLTPDNIDNSIKTLINILNSFKKTHKLSRPIIVADTETDYNEGTNENDETDSHLPGSITQTYPANTPEGGTPGRPGIDYPALSIIPHTDFDCQTQRYKGFFADPATNCQVWHYCDLNGGQASFLCPNGTIFSQVALTCDWWFNVKCSTTTQLYVLNERLYKYIIPLKPKFPEDYTGPLVDKYLALKFEEMEEKLRKEKKGKQNDKNEEVDKLQLLEGQIPDSQSHNNTTLQEP